MNTDEKEYAKFENEYYEKNPMNKDYNHSLLIMGGLILAAIALFFFGGA